MSIITMATSKGGAGKTTVAQALLGTLARRRTEVIRPLLGNDHRPRHLLEVPLLKPASKNDTTA